MSTESGIPDFRSQNGWWNDIDPRLVASVDAFNQDYPKFRAFYQMRMESLANCVPHVGHTVLANWQQRGLISLIATQNVDGLHQQAGATNVQELHGNITSIRCGRCEKQSALEAFLNGATCSYCEGHLRPNVVLFGELLPEQAWQASLRAIEEAALVLVIGTSLEVYPVNQLPGMTKGKLVYMNLDTASGRGFDLVLQGKAGELLAQIDALL